MKLSARELVAASHVNFTSNYRQRVNNDILLPMRHCFVIKFVATMRIKSCVINRASFFLKIFIVADRSALCALR